MTVLASNNKDGLIKHDQMSLLSFISSIVSDPHNSLSTWVSSTSSSSVDVCNWFGVKCNNGSTRVIELDISGQDLRGEISPSIANLTALTVLDLSRNLFTGEIPREIGSLHKTLKQLSLSENLLQGNIPDELGSLNRLVYLDLGTNRLTGQIPVQLFCNGSSSSLQYIDISNNSLTGEIPVKNNCHLKELRFLLLWSNKLVGDVPPSLSNSTKLKWIDLESNLLTGELPSKVISKMPHLQFLYLSYNHFISHNNNTNLKPFFTSLANSSDLQELELAGNSLGGEITSSIRHLSVNLVQIHLDQNHIHGLIPPEISNLLNLTLLNLSSNLLTGPIPRELCKLTKLERVYRSNNLLTGEIPVKNPDLLWDKPTIEKIIKACIILHNMIVEDERDGYTQFDVSEFVQVESNRSSHVDFMYSKDMPSNTGNLMAIRTRFRDRNIHEQLKNDLVEHIWRKFGTRQKDY